MIVFPGASAGQQESMNLLVRRYLEMDIQKIEDLGGWDPSEYKWRFVPWSWLQHRDRCERLILELRMMTDDKYTHELPQLHQHFLYWSVEAWLESAKSSLDSAAEDEKEDLGRDVEALEDAMQMAFENTDFLSPESIAESVLEGTPYVSHLGIDPHEFLSLMPDDIAERVERTLRELGDPGEPPGPLPPAE